jgi:hypothetical protein
MKKRTKSWFKENTQSKIGDMRGKKNQFFFEVMGKTELKKHSKQN